MYVIKYMCSYVQKAFLNIFIYVSGLTLHQRTLSHLCHSLWLRLTQRLIYIPIHICIYIYAFSYIFNKHSSAKPRLHFVWTRVYVWLDFDLTFTTPLSMLATRLQSPSLPFYFFAHFFIITFLFTCCLLLLLLPW